MMRIILVFLLLLWGATAHTQQHVQTLERSSQPDEYDPSRLKDTRDLNVLKAIQAEIEAEYTRPCGTHPHGSSWTEPCLAPLSNGLVTKACLSGIEVIKSATCTE